MKKKLALLSFPIQRSVKRLIATTLCVIAVSVFANAQVSPYSLLTNGDFESGISGVGFQTQAPYNYLAVLSGNSNPSDYAIITNPQPMNTANFISGTDHSGTGKMMVIDGTTTGGNQRFWNAGNTGGGVGPLTVGLTYTFSYWIKTVATTAVDASTAANILVLWGNAGSITLVSGNAQASFPGASATWQKVVYSFVPTNNFVNIGLSNNNTNPVGNDFAIDDLEVLPPPIPLTIKFSVVNPSCPNSTDGFVAVYGVGGTPPYTYSINGGAFSSNNIFSGYNSLTNAFVSVRDAATPIPTTVNSAATINIVPPANPLVIRPDTTICATASVPLYASGGSGAYTWTAVPPDPTIVNPNLAVTSATPAATTVYTVSSSVTNTRNLIFNGDFSQGDVGFYTEYTSFPSPPIPSNPSLAQRAYSIINNAQSFEVGFQPCTDHTTGTGNMLVADGSTNSANKVWQQKVPVTPATIYTFTYWLQSVVAASPAQIETQINGLPITGVAGTSTNNAPAGTCSWIQVTYTWNSGANTTAEISLINRNSAAGGNDFALDDISFTTTTTCSLSKSATVTVTSSSPVTGFSYTTPVCATAGNQTPTLVAGFTTGGTFSSTAGLSINSGTGVINVAASTPGLYTINYNIAASGCQVAGNSST
ncbi:MAG: hypothetical protein ACOYKE_02310, partial [Ferruginibacter sp.]